MANVFNVKDKHHIMIQIRNFVSDVLLELILARLVIVVRKLMAIIVLEVDIKLVIRNVCVGLRLRFLMGRIVLHVLLLHIMILLIKSVRAVQLDIITMVWHAYLQTVHHLLHLIFIIVDVYAHGINQN